MDKVQQETNNSGIMNIKKHQLSSLNLIVRIRISASNYKGGNWFMLTSAGWVANNATLNIDHSYKRVLSHSIEILLKSFYFQ